MFRRAVGTLASLAFLLVVAETSRARAYSPIPAFPGMPGVATSEVTYDARPLRAFLEAHTSPVGAKYTVLIVSSSDRDDRPGPDFGDTDDAFINAVVNAWIADADVENSVFIVMSMLNRDIIVHPFSRWSLLGFEREAVVHTIDTSPFARYARAGDYTQALASLVTAIDAELAARIARTQADTEYVSQAVAMARAAVARFENDALSVRFDLTAERANADRMLTLVREVEAAIARGDLTRAKQDAAYLRRDAVALDGAFTRLAESDARARTTLAAMRADQRVLARPRDDDDDATRSHLRTLEAALTTAERALALGRPEDAETALARADASEQAIPLARADAAFRHVVRTRYLPSLVGLCLLAALGAWLVSRVKRVLALRRGIEGHLATLTTALRHAGEKLVRLSNEHALFLSGPMPVTGFTGATEAPVREAATTVDDLFVEFEAATRIERAARALLEATGPLSLDTAERAMVVLTREPIVVRTEDVRAHRLLLPDHREIIRKPDELLADLERTYARATTQLDALGLRFGDAYARIDAITTMLRRIFALHAEASAHVPVVDFRTDAAALDARRAAIAEQAKRDPLGTEPEMITMHDEVHALCTRAETLAEAAHTIAVEVQPGLPRLLGEVTRLRAEGQALLEPTFDPDGLMAEARSECRAALVGLLRGNEEGALLCARRAKERLDTANRLIETSEHSRTESVTAIAGETARRARLLAALPERRKRLDALRGEYADVSLTPALDNATEADAVLVECAKRLVLATAQVAPSRHEYVAASEAIERTRRELDDVEALYDEIESKADELRAMCANIDAALDGVRVVLAEIEALLVSTPHVRHTGITDTVTALTEKLSSATALRSAPRIDVVVLTRVASELAREADETRISVRAEHAAYLEAEALRLTLGEVEQTLSRTFAEEVTDGRHANVLLGRAREARARLEARWPTLEVAAETRLEMLRALETEFDTARRAADDDRASAEAARTEIAAAHQAVRGLMGRRYADGDSDRAAARKALERAEKLLLATSYQEARVAAGEATRAIVLAERKYNDAQAAADAAEERARAAERRRAAAVEAIRLPRDDSAGWGSTSRGIFGGSASSRSGSSGSSGSSSRSSRSSGSSSYGGSSGSSSYGGSSGRSKW